jgi:hypothetical protein
MDCSKFEKYILLKSEGLSIDEQNALEQHLSACKSCRSMLESFENSKILVSKIVEKEPVLTNPGIISANIMRSIKDLENEKQGLFAGLLEQFLNWFFAPFVRQVFVGMAIIMIAGFIFQETNDQIQIAGLENRLKKYSVEHYVTTQETQNNYISQVTNKLSVVKKNGETDSLLHSKFKLRFSTFGQMDQLNRIYKSKQRKVLFKYLKKISPAAGIKQFSDSNSFGK